MRPLPPQHLTDGYFADVEDQLITIYFEVLLRPIAKIIKANNPEQFTIENANLTAVVKALRSGRIQYAKGKFTGEFSLAISQGLRSLGATFSKYEAAYHLEEGQIPHAVLQAAYEYAFKARAAHEAIDQELGRAMHYAIADRYDINAKKTVAKVDEGWRKSARRLEVLPELSKEARDIFASEYTDNLQLPIKRWLQDQITELRKDVQANAEAGYRFSSLIQRIKDRDKGSRRRAKFLARQETGLFMSKYRAGRFLEAGVTKYKWSTSHDSRVRPRPGLTAGERAHAGNHRILDGQTFDYRTKAPARYMSVGKACNPGEDYNCRCVDIPLP